jgi:hypothetical protein
MRLNLSYTYAGFQAGKVDKEVPVEEDPIVKERKFPEITASDVLEMARLIDETKADETPPIEYGSGKYIKPKFKFGDPIDFDSRLLYDKQIRKEILFKIVKQKCYFDPKYFSFNYNDRSIYTLDQAKIIRLDFDFIKADLRYVFFILSVMQLELLELVGSEDCDKLVKMASFYLKVKFEYSRRKRSVFYARYVNGIEIERRLLILTSEEFNSELESMIALREFDFNSRNYHFGDDSNLKKII